jgi:CubicO group peptidase (beta-lactamase class C family)
MAITAVALLRPVADGRLGLDDPANRYLENVRLADDEVSVRQLLSHAGGVTDRATLFAAAVQDLSALTGPVIACSGKRGVFEFSPAGYAALGEIIALSLTASRFPAVWPTSAAADDPAGYRP